MPLRDDPDDPRNMSDDERLEEVAGIFARGVLRLRARRFPEAFECAILSESAPTCLDPFVCWNPAYPDDSQVPFEALSRGTQDQLLDILVLHGERLQ